MSKTITMRVDDDVYSILKTAADGTKRTISNFLEFAAISYVSHEAFVSNKEMQEIMNDKALLKSLKASEKNIKEGKIKIVN
jgi:uncharacterized protein (DUF1778 family)